MSDPPIDDLWNFHNAAESEARIRHALANAEPGSEFHAELLTQLARAQGLQHNFAAAHATLDEATRLLIPTHTRAAVRLLLERGRVFNSAGEPSQAHPLFVQAWEAAQATGEEVLAVDAAHMVAIVLPPEEQLAWNLRALALAETAADPRAREWIVSLHNNIGWTYHTLGQNEQALASLAQTVEWHEATGRTIEARIARWSVSRILRTLGRVDEALTIQQQLAREWGESGASDGYVDEEIGECLLALERGDEAAPHFSQAYTLLSADPWLVANEPARLERLHALGRVSR